LCSVKLYSSTFAVDRVFVSIIETRKYSLPFYLLIEGNVINSVLT